MKIWSWGANNASQLGLGFISEQVSVPTEIKNADISLCPQIVSAISGGGCHTLILGSKDSKSVLNYFGEFQNSGNQQGSQTQKQESYPLNLNLQEPENSVRPQISCGWDFNIFLDSFGIIYTSGGNAFGQLGREVNDNSNSKKFSSNFARIEFERETDIISVSAGLRHAGAIGRNFEVYTWGDNSKGQLGQGQPSKTSSKIISKPSLVAFPASNPIEIRCSKYTTIILTADGYFYAAGLNKFGIFGENQSDANFPNFTKLPMLSLEVKDFQCGWNHVLVLLINGSLLSWGRNNFGQLGRKTTQEFDCVPGLVERLPEPIISIKCGTEHNLALGESGVVYSWGWNEHDNCGVKSDSTDQVISVPTIVPIPKSDESEKVIIIGCGAGTGFAVSESSK